MSTKPAVTPDAPTRPCEAPWGPQHYAETWPRYAPTAPSRAAERKRRHPVRNTFAVIGAALFVLVVVAIIFGKPPVTVIKGGGEVSHSAAAAQTA
jgi:hypothetical protein